MALARRLPAIGALWFVLVKAAGRAEESSKVGVASFHVRKSNAWRDCETLIQRQGNTKTTRDVRQGIRRVTISRTALWPLGRQH